MNEPQPRAAFRSMEQAKAEDWAIIGNHFMGYGKGLPDRVLAHLRLLDGDYGGFPVDRLEPVSYTHLTLPTTSRV